MAQTDLAKAHKDKMAELQDLLDKTDKDKPAGKDVSALRIFLNDNPALWAYVGDMAEQATYFLIDSLNGTEALKESMKAGYRQMQHELAAPGDTALERLLAQQVVLAWVRLSIIEYKYTNITNESIPLARADFWERRLNASQRRFLRACSTLARVRKMNVPAIQVNIGQQQVNQVNR